MFVNLKHCNINLSTTKQSLESRIFSLLTAGKILTTTRSQKKNGPSTITGNHDKVDLVNYTRLKMKRRKSRRLEVMTGKYERVRDYFVCP